MNADKNCDSVHSIGNGKVCAYIRGADIFDIFGPYYSTPPLVQLLLCDTSEALTIKRLEGSAVWEYSLNGFCSWSDFTAPEDPVFYRKIGEGKKIPWKLHRLAVEALIPIPVTLLEGTRFTEGWCGSVPAGTFFYSTKRDRDGRPLQGYPITDRLFVIIAVSGDCEVHSSGRDEVSFSMSGGDIIIICESGEEEGWEIFEKTKSKKADDIKVKTMVNWQDFTQRRLSVFNKHFPNMNRDYEQAADDIAVLLKTQQDQSGGILAGCNYHLAYVRDNYGCFRGLIALGCLEEAKTLIMYYIKVHENYGKVSTAQGMGIRAFHVHEHDFAENTGYLVLMVMEYFGLTGDTTMLKISAPLIRWALSLQRNHLQNGMLPFSGDETYIAGGILPRSHIQDGSMEATLLYHRGLELYLPVAKSMGLEDEQFLRSQEEAMNEIAETFEKNFVENGILYCNKPGLYDEKSAPPRRPGVMECGHGFGVSYRNKKGRYVCIECLDNNDLEPVPPKQVMLLSTAFIPYWVNSSLVPSSILRNMLKIVCAEWYKTGKLPSRPDGDMTVGYDYGLTLYALEEGLPEESRAIESIVKAMISVRDSAGAWVEYYRSGVPSGTPCRPWESAVNIAALLGTAK